MVAVRRPAAAATVVGVVLAVVGLFLLTGAGVGLGRASVLTLGCAVAFAVHIVLLAEFAPRFDVLRLNAVQLAVVGAVPVSRARRCGGYDFPARPSSRRVYTGVVVAGVAFGLQLWGQRHVARPGRHCC